MTAVVTLVTIVLYLLLLFAVARRSSGNADNATFLNPEYLITFLKNRVGILSGDPMKERYSVCRTGLYTADMKLFR